MNGGGSSAQAMRRGLWRRADADCCGRETNGRSELQGGEWGEEDSCVTAQSRGWVGLPWGGRGAEGFCGGGGFMAGSNAGVAAGALAAPAWPPGDDGTVIMAGMAWVYFWFSTRVRVGLPTSALFHPFVFGEKKYFHPFHSQQVKKCEKNTHCSTQGKKQKKKEREKMYSLKKDVKTHTRSPVSSLGMYMFKVEQVRKNGKVNKLVKKVVRFISPILVSKHGIMLVK